MKRASCVAMVTILMCISTVASAGSIGFGPRIGYQRAANADEGNMMYGAALRLKLLPFLGFEGSVDYRQQSYASDLLTVRSWPVQVTGLIYPIPVLYGALGAGWYNTTFDFDPNTAILEDDTQQDFGWHAGVGAEIPLGGVAALAADVRWVFVDMKFEQIPEMPERDSNFYMITAGLLFGL